MVSAVFAVALHFLYLFADLIFYTDCLLLLAHLAADTSLPPWSNEILLVVQSSQGPKQFLFFESVLSYLWPPCFHLSCLRVDGVQTQSPDCLERLMSKVMGGLTWIWICCAVHFYHLLTPIFPDHLWRKRIHTITHFHPHDPMTGFRLPFCTKQEPHTHKNILLNFVEFNLQNMPGSAVNDKWVESRRITLVKSNFMIIWDSTHQHKWGAGKYTLIQGRSNHIGSGCLHWNVYNICDTWMT